MGPMRCLMHPPHHAAARIRLAWSLLVLLLAACGTSPAAAAQHARAAAPPPKLLPLNAKQSPAAQYPPKQQHEPHAAGSPSSMQQSDYLRRLIADGFEVRPYPPQGLTTASESSLHSNSSSSSSSGSSSGGGGSWKLESAQIAAAGLSSLGSKRSRFSYQSTSSQPSDAAPACTQAFTTPGAKARSLAVILIKWRREYYPAREVCCAGSSDPNCDCTWGGYKYDELPPAKAYERMFSDECDGHMSMNRVS